MTKVAVDFRLARQGGVGRYIRTLLEGLEASQSAVEVTAFGPERYRSLLGESVSRAIEYVPFETAPFTVGEQVAVPRLLTRLGVNVVHVPYFNFPLFCSIPVVVTIHDLAWFHPEFVHIWRPAVQYSRLMIRQAMTRAALVVADSVTAGQEIIDFFPRRRCPVETIPLGLSTTFLNALEGQRLQTRAPASALYVGTFKPVKRVDVFLRAVALLRRKGVRVNVVLGGTPARNANQDMGRLAQELGIADQVCTTGPIGDPELARLYAQAALYVMPSEYEGFGLTTIEAMAAGCAIVAADVPVHREVAGEAAFYFRPSDPEDLAAKLLDLIGNDVARRELVKKGLERVQQFTAESLGRLTAGIYDRVAREVAG